ncbi:response regulator FixJ [Caulobacter sp.]|uniref:response regulator FixJ n=1 Tax=Caulobacter sp. TaxID=78 RepID=UPI003BA8E6A7
MTDGVVHIIDDDEALRDSLAFLLDSARMPCALYPSARDFLERLPGLANGCVLTDVRMPDMNGLELVRRLNTVGYRDPIVVMTGHADVPLAVEAMKEGVHDFIEKPFDDELMLNALDSALRRRAADRIEDDQIAELDRRLDLLSGREREVLEGLIAGSANKVIAFDLGISPRTVEIYRAHVMSKMQAASLSQLVRMVMTVRR